MIDNSASSCDDSSVHVIDQNNQWILWILSDFVPATSCFGTLRKYSQLPHDFYLQWLIYLNRGSALDYGIVVIYHVILQGKLSILLDWWSHCCVLKIAVLQTLIFTCLYFFWYFLYYQVMLNGKNQYNHTKLKLI